MHNKKWFSMHKFSQKYNKKKRHPFFNTFNQSFDGSKLCADLGGCSMNGVDLQFYFESNNKEENNNDDMNINDKSVTSNIKSLKYI